MISGKQFCKEIRGFRDYCGEIPFSVAGFIFLCLLQAIAFTKMKLKKTSGYA